MPKGTLQLGLRILNWHGPSVITNVFAMKEGCRRLRDLKMLRCWLWRWRKGPWTKQCRGPLEAGKSKQILSYQKEHSSANTCQHQLSETHFNLLMASTIRWVCAVSSHKPVMFVTAAIENQDTKDTKHWLFPQPARWLVYLACPRPPRKTRVPLRASQVPKNISSVVKTKVANDQLY